MTGESDRPRSRSTGHRPWLSFALAVAVGVALAAGHASPSTPGKAEAQGGATSWQDDQDPLGGLPRSTIVPPNQEPLARIATDPSGPVPTGTAVTITAAGSADPEGQPLKYRFDLDGDGVFERDTDVKPRTTTSYPRAGVYGVAVQVVDPAGAAAASETTVTATNRPPVAALAASTLTPAPRHTVGFDAASSADPEGTRLTYTWDLDGDGSFETATGEVPRAMASYSPHTDATVRVLATDADGGAAAAAAKLLVRDQPPYAKLSVPAASVRAGEHVVLSAADSGDPDGDALTYEWDLDGDGAYETPPSSDPRMGTSFPRAGQRRVRVRVSDGFGAVDSTSVRVNVTSPPPVGRPPSVTVGTSSRLGRPGAPVTLTAAGLDPDGDALTYHWALGGLPASGPIDQRQATTLYPSAAPVMVAVTVTDPRGNTATDSVRLAAWPRAQLAARRRILARGRRVAVPLTCPAAADKPCVGTIRIEASKQRRRWNGRRPRMAGRRLVPAPVSFRVKPGQTVAVGGWMTLPAADFLRRRSHIPAAITIAGPGGPPSAYEAVVTRT